MGESAKDTLDKLMNSEEYQEYLKSTLKSILSKTKAATTEASVASAFETELFHFVKQYLGKDIVFDKEIGQTDLKHKRHVFTGRMDAVSNDLVIEYKRPDKLVAKKDQIDAGNQVTNYLCQLYEERNIEYSAVLTDGQKVKYFYYMDKALHATPFKKMECEDLDKIIRSLVHVGSKKFVPENIISDFKLEADKDVTLKLAQSLFHMLVHHMTDKTDMLFQEWQELFHLSENDSGQNLDIEKRKAVLSKIFDREIKDNESDYKALFVLQTTYAIIVKLIACKVISRLSSDSEDEIMYFSDLTKVDSQKLRDFMESLEDGYTFAIGGIRNLLEGDFFSWYTAKEQWTDEEAEGIMNVIHTLEGYSDSSFSHGYAAIDIFKDLYMEIMPNEVRHSLGEYFTPSWLADYVIENSKNMISEKRWRAIDPCCGSGSFVVSLIKHVIGDREIVNMSRKERHALLEEIIDRVQGIDINPLSVLTARVSYLLAVAPLLGEEAIEIPIYLGDSANIPCKIALDGVACYQYVVNTKQGGIDITLPCSFVESQSFLEKMSILQTVIEAEDEDLVYKKLLSCIGDDEKNLSVLGCIRQLSERLVMLHKSRWDGIWLRIVTNYMLVARVNHIDMIVGNPPWVKWEFLPQVYAEKIKSLCLARHLFSGQTYMGAISLNICALISNVTASSWLKEDGVLAFLMPKTLMTQDSYAGFRNFYMDVEQDKRLFLQKVDDWSKAGNPFIYTTEKFLTYYYQAKKKDYSAGIPIANMRKRPGCDIRKINNSLLFEDVKDMFVCQPGKAYQLDESRTGFTMISGDAAYRTSLYAKIIGKSAYKARSGVEFTPAEIYFIEPVSEAGKKGKYRFRSSQFTNSVYKAKNNGEFVLETKYIRPVIKSPAIREFGIVESDHYCLFPYEESKVACVALDELCEKAEYTANYLISNRKLIEKQSKRSKMIAKGKEFYALSKLGKYTYGKNAVTFRDNTKLVAAVVETTKTPWGESVMPLCAKHSPYISMDKKGRFISEDEAHYLCGILNTDVVQEYYRFTFSERSYSIDFNIKMPLYDSKNKYQKRIAALSKKAHQVFTDADAMAEIKRQIEEAYLKLCESVD